MKTDIEFKNEFARLEAQQEAEAFMSKLEYEESLQKSEEPAKKIWTKEEIKEKMQTNDTWLYHGIQAIYARQTSDEQQSKETKHINNVGFNGADAAIMSSFAEFLKKTGFLTPKQKNLARKKMSKYAGQLATIANV